jgi:molybdopterin synthase catalytic subunit
VTADIGVQLVEGPLAAAAPFRPEGAGAVLVFEGIVRPLEDARPLAALRYEAYEPMTTRLLHELSSEVSARHQLIALRLEHSQGRVPAGGVSFRLAVAAAHRKTAIAAIDELIDRLKADVPLWKVPEWPAEGDE